MLVGERMTKPVITVAPDVSILDALDLMKRENIRRTPVIKDGHLLGIVSLQDLLNASPSQATSLSIWELNYLVSKIKVADVMTARVITVTEDTPIEIAARMMVDNKIGGLPVMRGKEVVGIITETDLFKIFLELMGARENGVRVTALVPDIHGQLAAMSGAVSQAGGDFIAFGVFSGETSANKLVTFKVAQLELENVRQIIQPYIDKLVDIRICCD